MMKSLDLDSGKFLKKLLYRVKANTYVAYMLKFISLTVSNFEKTASCVDDPVKNVSYLCPKLFYSLDYNYRIQHYKLFGFKQGTVSRALPNI